MTVALIAQDLKKCYEYVRYLVLARAGIKHKFPLALLRLTVLSYAWPRHLCTGRLLSNALHAKRGMIAGCAAATRELKAYMKDAMVEVVCRNPNVDIEAWIDDINAQAMHEDEDVCESLVTAAAKDLQETVGAMCHFDFAGPKLAVVASRESWEGD